MKSRIALTLSLLALVSSSCGKNNDKPQQNGQDKPAEEPVEKEVIKEVAIGDQIWMAENVRITDNVTCYANTEAEPDFIKKYGCLYARKDLNKVCPAGWRLPGALDFEELLAFTKGAEDPSVLRDSSWADGSNGSGFGALPAGFYGNIDGPDLSYTWMGQVAFYWTTTNDNSGSTKLFGILHQVSDDQTTSMSVVTPMSFGDRDFAFSVRCIKNTCDNPLKMGKDCSKCVDNRLTGDNCSECVNGFMGENCTTCANSHFSGFECNQCLPAFTGSNCDVCADDHFAGANCDQCSAKFTGTNCDQCADGIHTGYNCEECLDGIHTGDNCDQCADGIHVGEYCDECSDGIHFGENCDECPDDSRTGEYCEDCKNGCHGDACELCEEDWDW